MPSMATGTRGVSFAKGALGARCALCWKGVSPPLPGSGCAPCAVYKPRGGWYCYSVCKREVSVRDASWPSDATFSGEGELRGRGTEGGPPLPSFSRIARPKAFSAVGSSQP